MNKAVLVAAVGLVLSGVASAGPIVNGGIAISFGGLVLSPGGSDLSNATSITSTGGINLDPGVGDFSVVPGFSLWSGFTLNLTSPGTGGGFSFTSSSGHGTFTANEFTILTKTSSNLVIYFLGTYTNLDNPGTCGSSPCDPSPASFNAGFTKNGNIYSLSGTLNSPPVPPVPEPATMVLMGSAMIGVALYRRRRAA